MYHIFISATSIFHLKTSAGVPQFLYILLALRFLSSLVSTTGICDIFFTCGCLPRRGNGDFVKILTTCSFPIARRYMWKQLKQLPMFVYTPSRHLFLRSNYRFTLDKHTSDFVWAITVVRCVGWPSTRAVQTRPKWSGKYLSSITENNFLSERPVVETA